MSAQKTFGINGFGRIGRTAFRVWWLYHRQEMDLKVINTSGSMPLADWVHLIKYDSNYGQFTEQIDIEVHQSNKETSDEDPTLGTLTIGGRKIIVTAQRNPEKIPWGANDVHTVIESTGVFTSEEKAMAHIAGGAKSVVISAPGKGGNIGTSVIGVNQFNTEQKIHSNASCTTNCVAPIAQIMHDRFVVKQALLTTIHSYTDDQNTQDNSHKDLRRARTAASNIIPTTTGAAVATTEIIPELAGLFDGLAVRVPTPVGSLSDITFLVEKATTKDEVNEVFRQASQTDRWRGVLATTDEPLVSSDIVGRRESSIVDLDLTYVVGGTLVKVISWYDNEFGYCNRLVEQVLNT